MKKQNLVIAFKIILTLSLLVTACWGSDHEENKASNSGGFNYNFDQPQEELSLPSSTGSNHNEPSSTFAQSDSPGEALGSGIGGDSVEEPSYERLDSASDTAPEGFTAPSISGNSPQPLPTMVPHESEPEDMFFEDYGVNPFLDTEDDNLSTFSLDVDTGSFTIARSYLASGNLPPADAVRVEEFINYFPQGYPIPTLEEIFGLYVDGAPSPFTETERYNMLRIGIQGYDVSRYERKPVSLTFVIDVSGSMHEDGRLELVKDALSLLIDQLDREDQVSIIAYSTSAWIVLEPTPGHRKGLILEAIYSLYPMNSTNAEAGLVLGYDVATKAYLPGGINRVVLCSDGVANVGNTGPDSIWERIRYQASEGITLTAVGVGMGNYNDVLLEQLADNGEGFYAYIDTMDEAERLFVHDLVSMLQIIAMDAKVQVDFNPEVVSRYRLVGYENRDIADEDFRNDTVDAAEIGAGHSVTALYEFKLHPGARGEIATVYLRWQDPETGRVYETAETFYIEDMEDSFRLADPYFQLDILVAEFAEILRESYWANSDFEEVLDYAESTSRVLENQEVYEFLDMLEEAARLNYH